MMRQQVSWDEVQCFSSLVSTQWLLTGRNPTDAECREMVGIARELTAGALLRPSRTGALWLSAPPSPLPRA